MFLQFLEQQQKSLDLSITTVSSRNMSTLEDFLPLEMGYLTPEMLKISEEELGETEEKKARCLEELRALLRNERDLTPRMDDEWLLAYLRGRKFNVERAFKSMENTYRILNEHRHTFDSGTSDSVHNIFRQNYFGFLPRRDMNGRVIAVAKIGEWDPEVAPVDMVFWCATTCALHTMLDPATQVLGYIAVADMRGFAVRHLKMCTPGNIRLAIRGSQDCFPGRIRAVHVVGLHKLVLVAYNIIYPFLPRKLKSRIFLHGDNLESLHEKIPPCILPSEFGGELGHFDNKSWHDALLSRHDWTMEQLNYGYK